MKHLFACMACLGFLLVSGSVFPASGDKLAFMMYSGDNWQVHLMDLDNRQVAQLTTKPYDVSTVSWLQDGEHVYICGIQGQSEIININDGSSRDIRLPYSAINDAVISPDGSKLVFSHIRPGGSLINKLWLMDIEKNAATPILVDHEGMQYDPKWSSNGEEVYFITGEPGRAFGISKYSLLDNKVTRVVHNDFYNLDADIGPDGKLAYSSNVSGNFDVWTQDDRSRARVTASVAAQTHPSWSGDGKKLYFEMVTDGISNIWSVESVAGESGAAPVQLTSSPVGARYPVVYRGRQ